MKRTVRERKRRLIVAEKCGGTGKRYSELIGIHLRSKISGRERGAAGLRYTPGCDRRGSTTAITMVFGSAATAAAWTSAVTSAAERFDESGAQKPSECWRLRRSLQEPWPDRGHDWSRKDARRRRYGRPDFAPKLFDQE